MTSQMNLKRQHGFTLIELIMVIVILGILSAFALPKFADFSGDAETSSAEGARGAVRSASAIAHAAFLANGSSGSTVTLEGETIDMVGGYPTANAAATNGNICDAAGIEAGDFTCATTSGDGTNDSPRVMTITLSGTSCAFTFTEVDADGDPAVPSISALSGC